MLQRTIRVELVLEQPLPSHNIGLLWTRNEVPSVVLEKGSELLFQSNPPIGVGEAAAEGLRHWRQRRGVEQWARRHPEATLRLSAHWVRIIHWSQRRRTLG